MMYCFSKRSMMLCCNQGVRYSCVQSKNISDLNIGDLNIGDLNIGDLNISDLNIGDLHYVVT